MKPPLADPARVLKYLSRYTHRVAISNHRLRFVGDGLVRFGYTAYADHGRRKEMTLTGEEFLRRFLLHVVPRGFMRIRHYGIVANREREQKLARSRELLLDAPTAPAPASAAPVPGPTLGLALPATGHLVAARTAADACIVSTSSYHNGATPHDAPAVTGYFLASDRRASGS